MSATNRGTVRSERDRYPTPPAATRVLLNLIDWSRVRSFGEPCIGSGAIWHEVAPFIHPDASCFFCEIDHGTDYFKFPWSSLDLIITNPPYALAHRFLEKSLSEAACVCYLLRLNILGGGGLRGRIENRARKAFFQRNPPTHLFVLSERPSFTVGGTDATEYAWFCWDRADLIRPSTPTTVLEIL